jgi:hypothetical protein
MPAAAPGRRTGGGRIPVELKHPVARVAETVGMLTHEDPDDFPDVHPDHAREAARRILAIAFGLRRVPATLMGRAVYLLELASRPIAFD